MNKSTKVTQIANPNIAIIKYWGKEDMKENVCSNSSLSFQLTKFETRTSIDFNTSDLFVLNEKQEEMPQKMKRAIDFFRKIAGNPRPIKVESSNNFPHSCGLASSASGYAALIKALNAFYNTTFNEEDLSILARKCSGSASRSIPKGLVLCNKYSSQTIGDQDDVRIFLIILNKDPKYLSSTEGMLRTQSTSFLYKDRLARVNEKVELCAEYLKAKDYQSAFKMIMRDSNETHAVMFETYPPIRYINDEGFSVIRMVHKFNVEKIKAAYTFDAGPNPFIITTAEYEKDVVDYFKLYDLIKCN